MNRIILGTLATVAVAGLVTAGVHAQGGRSPDDQDGPFRGGRGPRAQMTQGDREAFADARIAALRAGLRLTPDQDKLWPPVEDAMRGLAKQRAEAREARRERWSSLRQGGDEMGDIPARLRFMADRQAASAEALRRLADASAPLYASLDEGQRRRMRFLARGMGPGHGMREGPGMMRRGDREGGSNGFAERGPNAGR